MPQAAPIVGASPRRHCRSVSISHFSTPAAEPRGPIIGAWHPPEGIPMSVYWLSLHVHGLLVSLEPVVRMLEGCRHRITRADERFVGPGWITPVHVLSVDLGRR